MNSGDWLLRHCLDGMARLTRRSGLIVLIYHRVLPRPDPMMPDVPDQAMFAMHMSVISRFFRVAPLRQALFELQDGKLQVPTVAVTFDDGYVDNLEVALPILQKYSVPATVFVAPGFLDGGLMFNDAIIEIFRQAPAGNLCFSSIGHGDWSLSDWQSRRDAAAKVIMQVKYLPLARRQELISTMASLAGAKLPGNLMLSSEQLRQLHRAGICIGAHTVNHPILARLDDEAAAEEIGRSKMLLEQLLTDTVDLFAYPNGKPSVDYLPQHTQQAKEAGFCFAVSTRDAVARQTDPTYEIPRFGPWDRSAFRLLLRMSTALFRRSVA